MKSLKQYILTGILFVSAAGTLLHFAYEWSQNNVLVGFFTPVNESIWEHTKLIFFPMLLYYSLPLRNKIMQEYHCIGSAVKLGSLVGVLLIIVLFYTYSGILGYHVSVADISIFYISVIASSFVIYQATKSCKAEPFDTLLQILQILMICLFILFTYSPPDIALFIQPEMI